MPEITGKLSMALADRYRIESPRRGTLGFREPWGEFGRSSIEER